MSELSIRFATSEDARWILGVHHSAVHDVAARDYPDDVLGDWSPPVTNNRIDEYLREASSPHWISLVVEVGGEIVGYGTILESDNALRDLYISANWGRRGIGSTLLYALEKAARERGCKELKLNATLTGYEFYLRHGYRELERGEHTLWSGRKMACIRMQKQL